MIKEKPNMADMFELAHPGTSLKKAYPRPFHFAVVGATGIVGRELLSILAEGRIPVASVRAVASQNSAGEKIEFGDEELTVEALSDEVFDGVDGVFCGGFCACKTIHPCCG